MGKAMKAYQAEIKKYQDEVTDLEEQKKVILVTIGEIKQSRKTYIMTMFGSNRKQDEIKAFDLEIKKNEHEYDSIDEQITELKMDMRDIKSRHIESIRKEFGNLKEKHDKTTNERIVELFKVKFETMQKFEEIYQEQAELQNELNRYTSVMESRNENLPEILLYNPDYLLYGDGAKVPVGIQNGELRGLEAPNGGHRLPNGYLLFKLTGEVEPDEGKARKKLEEARKIENKKEPRKNNNKKGEVK